MSPIGKVKGLVIALICLLIGIAGFLLVLKYLPDEAAIFTDMIDSFADLFRSSTPDIVVPDQALPNLNE